MFSGRFSGVTPVFAAKSTCHVGGRLVTSNHFSLPLPHPTSASTVLLHAPLHTPNLHQSCAFRQPPPPPPPPIPLSVPKGNGGTSNAEPCQSHFQLNGPLGETLKRPQIERQTDSSSRTRHAGHSEYLDSVHPLLVRPGITWRDN